MVRPVDHGISVEALRAAITYDPITGDMFWRVDRARKTIKAGAVCGCVAPTGYRTISFDGSQLKAHRVAWAIHYGKWPGGVIDHIDHNRANNAIANLRDVSYSTNSQNMVVPMKNNKAGLLGAYPTRGRWASRILVNGVRTFIGSFDTPEEAHCAYVAAKRAMHPGNTL